MATFRLLNRLHRSDAVRHATIELFDAQGKVAVSATTNAYGGATLNLKDLKSGTFNCVITPPEAFEGEVGPDLEDSGPVPDRVYRPANLTMVISAGVIQNLASDRPEWASVTWNKDTVNVSLQPVWMWSKVSNARGRAISAIIIHHTGCGTSSAVNTFLSEKGPHYMIDTDGQVVKWVQDVLAAAHAGESRWDGEHAINSESIGIEIVHTSGPFPEVQYTALISLLNALLQAHPEIEKWNIIGHNDIGTTADGRLGRKSGDPGLSFEWPRLERLGLGLLPTAGPPSLEIYSGFFQTVKQGAFRNGDHDSKQIFGAHVHKDIKGGPVQELQQDLTDIGYSLNTPDGVFDVKTEHAVLAFQEHFVAALDGRKPTGRVDFATAALIKSVASGRP